ncbi:hypothetical protein E2320_012115 [Naja naja]|nr:hypothetical protein E2320_012115 [Naja naja]
MGQPLKKRWKRERKTLKTSSKALYPCPGKLGTYNGLYLPGEKFFYCLSKGEEPIPRFPLAERGIYIYIFGEGKKIPPDGYRYFLKKKNNGFCLKEDF